MSNEIADRKVAANMRAEMARAGVSQSTIADQLGISPSGLSRRLAGHLSFRVGELCAIADLLGIPAHTLLDHAPTAA